MRHCSLVPHEHQVQNEPLFPRNFCHVPIDQMLCTYWSNEEVVTVRFPLLQLSSLYKQLMRSKATFCGRIVISVITGGHIVTTDCIGMLWTSWMFRCPNHNESQVD